MLVMERLLSLALVSNLSIFLTFLSESACMKYFVGIKWFKRRY